MKKIILIAAVALSFNASAQKKDSVKTAKADSVYVLVGSLPEFQLLYKSIVTPNDVTPNQLAAIAKWLQSIKALPAKQ